MIQACQIYLTYFLFFLVSVAALFVVGNVSLRLTQIPIKLNKFASIFWSIFIGIILFNIFYASFRTSFKTVQTLFLIPIVFVLIEYFKFTKPSQNSNNVNNNNWKTLWILLSYALIIYTFCFFRIISGNTIPYVLQDGDYVFYSNNSVFFNLTGQENFYNNINLVDANFRVATPHHYFHTWLNSGISFFLGGLSLMHLFLNTFPVFYLLTITGILGIWEYYSSIGIKQIFYSLFFMFLSGTLFENYFKMPILSEIHIFCLSALYGLPKLISYYVFAIAWLLLFKKGWKTISYIVLMSIPIANITAFFAVFGGFIAFFFINIKWKFIEVKEFKRLLIYLFVIGLSLPVFYYVFGRSQLTMEGASFESMKNYFNSNSILNDYIIRVHIFIITFLLTTVGYLPFVLIFILFRKYFSNKIFNLRANYIPICLIACMYFSGLISWMIFYKLLSGVQLFYNPAIPLLNSVLIFFVINFIVVINNRNHSWIFISLIMLVCAFNFFQACRDINDNRKSLAADHLYSEKYLEKIKEFANMNKDVPAGVSFCSKIDHSDNIFSYYHNPLGADYLSFFKDGLLPFKLCVYEFNSDTNERGFLQDRKMNAVKLSPFYQFVLNQKKNENFISIEQSQLDFINKFNVKYAIFSKNASIPLLIIDKIKEQFVDSISGEKFTLLK